MSKVIAIVSTMIALTLVNWSIYQKEKHLQHGAEVLLELAPVDPRSLMQGDYMTLRLALATDIRKNLSKEDAPLLAQDGKVIVTINENGIATFKSLNSQHQASELALKYRVRDERIKFGTNAFFFEEGTAKHFEAARYGVFRVANDGEMILVDLASEDFRLIKKSLLAERSAASASIPETQ